MSAINEYLPTPLEDQSTGNSEKFYSQLDEEVRALTDKNLSAGAARMFCLLVKLSWQPKHGGRYKGRVGSICISTRELGKLLNADIKSFFDRKQRKRDEDGKWQDTGAVNQGWISSLVGGGYVWLGRHRIPNIPDEKSINVYNVCCLIPQTHQPNLPWSDGNWGGEVIEAGEVFGAGEGGAPVKGSGYDQAENGFPGVQTAKNPKMGAPNGNFGDLGAPKKGSCQYPKTGAPNSPLREQAIPENGSRELPKRGVASSQKGELAIPENGSSQLPKTGAGSSQKGGSKESLKEPRLEKKIPRAFNRDNRSSEEGETGGKKAGEDDFMLLAMQTFGKPEMANNGGLWRTLYRQNSDKAWRVINDVVQTLKTNPTEIQTTPCKFAMDLWGRFK